MTTLAFKFGRFWAVSVRNNKNHFVVVEWLQIQRDRKRRGLV